MGSDTFWTKPARPGQRTHQEAKERGLYGDSAVLHVGPDSNVDWLVLPDDPALGGAAGHRVKVKATDLDECPVCNQRAKFHTTSVGYIVIECEQCSQWYVCELKKEVSDDKGRFSVEG